MVLLLLGWRPTPEDPGYTCDQCGKIYKLKTSLANHVKYACAKTKSFFCHLCDKSYGYKHHLKRHLLSHIDTSVGMGVFSFE